MNRTRLILISLISGMWVAGVGVAYGVDDEKSYAQEKPYTDTAIKNQQAKSGNYVEPKMSHEPYGTVKIVIPITTDEKNIHTMKLRNIENGLNSATQWGGQIQNTVVLYGKGVSLLKNPDPEMQKKIDALKGRDVQFVVCDNTLREQGVDFHQLYRVVDRDIVPSGFAEVAYLQAKKNYVVDPIN